MCMIELFRWNHQQSLLMLILHKKQEKELWIFQKHAFLKNCTRKVYHHHNVPLSTGFPSLSMNAMWKKMKLVLWTCRTNQWCVERQWLECLKTSVWKLERVGWTTINCVMLFLLLYGCVFQTSEIRLFLWKHGFIYRFDITGGCSNKTIYYGTWSSCEMKRIREAVISAF